MDKLSGTGDELSIFLIKIPCKEPFYLSHRFFYLPESGAGCLYPLEPGAYTLWSQVPIPLWSRVPIHPGSRVPLNRCDQVPGISYKTAVTVIGKKSQLRLLIPYLYYDKIKSLRKETGNKKIKEHDS